MKSAWEEAQQFILPCITKYQPLQLLSYTDTVHSFITSLRTVEPNGSSYKENDHNLDLSQGYWHGDQGEPEVGQWEIEDEKVPEEVLFNIESGGKKSQSSCASEQMRPWMEKLLPGISEPGKKKNCQKHSKIFTSSDWNLPFLTFLLWCCIVLGSGRKLYFFATFRRWLY